QQAAAVEPLIAGYWQEGREGSRHAQRVFWTRLADDGLLPPNTDLSWVLDTYQAWVAATSTRLLTAPGGISALPDPELVDEGSPDRVPLVVAHPAGQEVEFVGGDGGNPDRQV